MQSKKEGSLEGALEGYVLDWMQFQYGWGWSGQGFENDFSFMEGDDGSCYVVTHESAIPNTTVLRFGKECPKHPSQ